MCGTLLSHAMHRSLACAKRITNLKSYSHSIVAQTKTMH